jgi:hypothetical protein
MPKATIDSKLQAKLERPGVVSRGGRNKTVDQGNGIKNLVVPMDADFHRDFKKYCAARDLDMASVARAQIKNLLVIASGADDEQMLAKAIEFLEKNKNIRTQPAVVEASRKVDQMSKEELTVELHKEDIP